MVDRIVWGSIAMCALDFCRALRERGKLRNWIFKLLVGKYAYREYELLLLNLQYSGFYPEFDYGLEDCEYHKKTIQQIKDNWEKEK